MSVEEPVPSFDWALAVAGQVHSGQKDKAGEPYILHPIRVALKFKEPFLRCLALLHDTIEDSRDDMHRQQVEGDIRAYFGTAMLSCVQILSRERNESYPEYIQRLADCRPARLVKIADLEDNLHPSRRRNGWTLPLEKEVRYLNALRLLKVVELTAMHPAKAELLVQKGGGVSDSFSEQSSDSTAEIHNLHRG